MLLFPGVLALLEESGSLLNNVFFVKHPELNPIEFLHVEVYLYQTYIFTVLYKSESDIDNR